MIGTVYNSGTMMLRFNHGKAEVVVEEITYELSSSNFGSPVIRSSKTGKFYFLKWEELISLAIEAGINEPEVTS